MRRATASIRVRTAKAPTKYTSSTRGRPTAKTEAWKTGTAHRQHDLVGPVEPGDTVLDLGTGSGYALRALRSTNDAGPCYGLDGSPEMLRNAREYTDDDGIGFLRGDFDALPFATDSIDHVFSMEAFYYAADPTHTLRRDRARSAPRRDANSR